MIGILFVPITTDFAKFCWVSIQRKCDELHREPKAELLELLELTLLLADNTAELICVACVRRVHVGAENSCSTHFAGVRQSVVVVAVSCSQLLLADTRAALLC